jgi:hypothetical protein
MNIQYNTLFSINLRHNYYTNGLCPDFDIVPTAECQANLRRFGLGAKRIGGVLLVYFEQSVATAKPRLKLTDWTRFSFMMQLKQFDFYNYTVLPNVSKPFFFSNLNENGVEKAVPTEGSILSKTIAPDAGDLMDIKTNAFTVNHPLGTTEVKVSILRPQVGFQLAKTIEAQPLTASTSVNLPDFQNGLVKIETNSSPTPQYLYSDVGVAAVRPFGIIDIWKGAATNYNVPQIYTLNWTRKEDFWRYFIVKKDNLSSFSILIENVKAAEYPATARFDFVSEADRTALEKQLISHYTDADIDLFRSSVPLPQFERPFGKIRLSDTHGRIEMLLPQPTFRSTDTNIIVKIQKS